MGELAAAVAHQINNPLTTIVLDTELLLETETLDTEALRSAERDFARRKARGGGCPPPAGDGAPDFAGYAARAD